MFPAASSAQSQKFCALEKSNVIRSMEQLNKYYDCNIIVGSLDLEGFSFIPGLNSTDGFLPNLREITGYLRMSNIHMGCHIGFPFRNLAVVRGADTVDYHLPESTTITKAALVLEGVVMTVPAESDPRRRTIGTCVLDGAVIIRDVPGLNSINSASDKNCAGSDLCKLW